MTVLSVRFVPPLENAALILSGSVKPGMSTLRSRGIDISVMAGFLAFRRARMIVSERWPAARVGAEPAVGAEDHDRLRLARLGRR